MRYRKVLFQGLQARRAQAWILNKESGPGEKTREGEKNMESRGARGHWCRIGNSRALDVQGKKEYLGSMVASWAFIYIVSYILDQNSFHRRKQIFTELWNSYPEAVGLNVWPRACDLSHCVHTGKPESNLKILRFDFCIWHMGIWHMGKPQLGYCDWLVDLWSQDNWNTLIALSGGNWLRLSTRG